MMRKSLKQLVADCREAMRDFDGEARKTGLRCQHHPMVPSGPLDGFHIRVKCRSCGEEFKVERAAWIAGGIQYAMGKLR